MRACVHWGNKVTPSSLHPAFQRSPVKSASAEPVHLNSSLLPLWQQLAAVVSKCVCTARSLGAAQTWTTLSFQGVLFYYPSSFQGWGWGAPDSEVTFAFDPPVSCTLSLLHWWCLNASKWRTWLSVRTLFLPPQLPLTHISHRRLISLHPLFPTSSRTFRLRSPPRAKFSFLSLSAHVLFRFSSADDSVWTEICRQYGAAGPNLGSHYILSEELNLFNNISFTEGRQLGNVSQSLVNIVQLHHCQPAVFKTSSLSVNSVRFILNVPLSRFVEAKICYLIRSFLSSIAYSLLAEQTGLFLVNRLKLNWNKRNSDQHTFPLVALHPHLLAPSPSPPRQPSPL